MKSKDIEERFNDLISSEKFICTQEEFDDFQNYGYLIPMGKAYLTRVGKKVNVDIIKQKAHILNLDLSGLINGAIKMSKDNNFKRIYCMSENTYNKYLEKGYVVEKNNKKYYRLFEGEMWLIMII